LEDHGERDRSGAWILPAGQVERMPPALARQVIRLAVRDLWGEGAAIRFDLVEQAIGMAGAGRSGAVPLPGGGEVSREGPLLRIGPAMEPGRSYAVPVPFGGEAELPDGRRLRTSLWAAGKAPHDARSLPADIALFDAHRIEPPLLARTRLPGDRFRPLGAPGEKKLQDLLVDRKVPRSLRDRIPILADGEGIVWVCGLVIADRAKITARTTRVLEVAISSAGDDTIAGD